MNTVSCLNLPSLLSKDTIMESKPRSLHGWCDLRSGIYSGTLSFQRCGTEQRGFDRYPGLGTARSLARSHASSLVSSAVKNVRTRIDRWRGEGGAREAAGRNESEGRRRRDCTERKAASARERRRAGVCRASERVSGRGRGDPLHFQGKGLTKAGRGVS